MASIMCSSSSSDQRLSTSKRRLKPLLLRDYLLDDLSSCSSNGFKSFPRRPPSSSSSSTVRRLVDAEIKRSGLIHHHHNKPRLTRRSSRTTCGTALSHAVHKASTAFLNAVKLLPFPSSATVKSSGDNNKKQSGFSRSFSKRSFWRKPVSHSRRREVIEVQWWISAAFSPSSKDIISQTSTAAAAEATFSISTAAAAATAATAEEATFSVSQAAEEVKNKEFISGDSSSSGSEFFTSEVVQSSSSFSTSSSTSSETEEVSNENGAGEDGEAKSEGEEECLLNAHDCEESSVTGNNSLCNRKECMNEEKEQLSPVSILECPFEDDENDEEATDDDISQQNDTYENIARKGRRVNGLARLEPLELEKRIEKYVEIEEEYAYHTIEIEEDESETRANRLFALVKSRIGDKSDILTSKVADNLLLDYLQEDNVGEKEESLMVKRVEEWVMGRQEEMFMSWAVREKREVYVKEMQWGCITEDEKECVVEDLANGFFTTLVDEFIFDLA